MTPTAHRNRSFQKPKSAIGGGFAALAMLALAPAEAAFAATVDQMTCAAATAQVQATGRYDKRTGFGVVPIIPPWRTVPGQGANCPVGSTPSFNFERTRDVAVCVLGYSCEFRVKS